MKKGAVVLLVVWLGMSLVAPHGECKAAKSVKAPHVWFAPDSSWAVMGFGKLRPGLAERIMATKPPELDGLRIYAMEVKEPAVYLGFQVEFRRVQKVVFTKSTKIVLLNREGESIESEAIFFCPDYLQTQLYDSRKMAVVVTKTSVWCNPDNGCPGGWVKFPAGSIELKNIVSFEVVGAIVDTLQRARE